MKLTFVIVILACWSNLSIASDDHVAPKFANYMEDLKLYCQHNLLSLNFINSVITKIGRDFIDSHLIDCLDFSNNQIETVEDGAFNKLPKLTKLFLSHNKFANVQDLFTLGSHETLEVLALDNLVTSTYNTDITISGSYPSLEILLLNNNGFNDMFASTQSPFPKLKTLDLSSNGMKRTKFVELLPASLEHIYLHDNSFTTFTSLKNGSDVTTLTLDNNRIQYLKYYSNNPTAPGLWLYHLNHLRYLSITNNDIRTIDSNSFQSLSNLTYLNLSGNAINTLYPETFAKLESLHTLDLSRNQFSDIINISAVININILSMSCNKIRIVPEHSFKHMPELRELSLNGNDIGGVAINGFAYLYHLEMLDLSNNRLSSLPEGWADAFGSLRVLDLADNRFMWLESLSLSNTLPLVDVYLMTNPLMYLNATSFDHLPQNVTVSLSNRLHEGATRC